ncbi:molybdenum cofactor guanylyltransferase [Salinactinospora qingdaonensis]|uniref:MobA-like NTP transferase domain-containing protein n=1 Tax=Salinactinospora qingdaonensis TaxID=702744 RepID=A0ABP7FH69_9ACTN
MSSLEPFDAVILAGGRARRLGGADKPGLAVGETTLLERVAAAAGAARRTVVVGPPRSRPSASYVREDPPGGGPVAALRAGMALVDQPWLALLAGDLPFVRAEALDRLRREAAPDAGAVLLDREAHPQWLLGVWHTASLRAALTSYPGRSLRGLLAPLEPVRLSPQHPDDVTALDCDTPEDLARARSVAAAAPAPPE